MAFFGRESKPLNFAVRYPYSVNFARCEYGQEAWSAFSHFFTLLLFSVYLFMNSCRQHHFTPYILSFMLLFLLSYTQYVIFTTQHKKKFLLNLSSRVFYELKVWVTCIYLWHVSAIFDHDTESFYCHKLLLIRKENVHRFFFVNNILG